MVTNLWKKAAARLKRKKAPAVAGPPPELPAAKPAEDFPTRFARLFFGVLTLIILYFSYLIIKPYLVEIFLALVLFFQTKPLYQLMLRLCWGWRGLAAALTCVILALLIIVPILMLTSIIASQALELYNLISAGLHAGDLWQLFTRKLAFVEKFLQELNLPLKLEDLQLEQVIRQALVTISQFVYNNAIGLVRGFASFVFSLLLVLFVTFFCFLEGDRFLEEIKKLSPLDPKHNEEILGDVEVTIRATIRGTVLVAVIQGILTGIGFVFFGVPRAAFWGTIAILAAILPVVGPAIIWLPASLYLFFLGQNLMALGMLFWGVAVIGTIDNILKPLLMKGARQTPVVFTLFAIMGGINYFGMVGFILGPLILSFLLSVLSIYRKTILRPVVEKPLPEGELPPPSPAKQND